MSDCVRCQAQARQHEQKLRTMREALAVAELRHRLLKQGKTPTRAQEQEAKKNANARHAAKDRAEQFQAKEKNVPAHRRIRCG